MAHGWMLGLYHRPLVRDEVQAWQYGPVIPKLSNAIRDYRGQPVIRNLNASTDNIDHAARSIVNQVYEIYCRHSGPALSRLTHAPGTPWALTYDGHWGTAIPNDLIEDHYAQLARARTQMA